MHFALRKLLGINPDADFDVCRLGLRWVLNPSDFMHQDLFWLGAADRWELFHIRQLLRPGSVVLDVGANAGFYSLVLASALEGQCQIHAFEPVEDTYARLVHHIALNKFNCIRAHRLALSDVSGWAKLHRPLGNSGAAYLETGRGREIPVTTLDEFAAEHFLRRVDFIKIDVEGFEEKVLRGGRATLSRHRPILLVELQPLTLQRAGSSVPRLLDLLDELGYEVKEPRWRRLVPLKRRTKTSWLVNVFCFPARSPRVPSARSALQALPAMGEPGAKMALPRE